MTHVITVSLLALASVANAQTCEYKSVMTDAEIEACRHAPSIAALSNPKPPTSDEKAIAEKFKATLDAQMTRERTKRAELRAAAAAAPKNPYIGMTIAEAMTINDGIFHHYYREKVNITKNARGQTEQWVYGQGHYLYFDNGILTSIQE